MHEIKFNLRINSDISKELKNLMRSQIKIKYVQSDSLSFLRMFFSPPQLLEKGDNIN